MAANLRTVRWIETSPRHSGAVRSRHREETAVNLPGRSIRCLALAACLVASGPVLSAKRDNTVRFAYDQAPENVDPFFNNVRIGVIIGQHVWDSLIYRDPTSGSTRGSSRPPGDRSTTRRSSSTCARASNSTMARSSTPTTSSTRSTSSPSRRTRSSRQPNVELDRARREDRQIQGPPDHARSVFPAAIEYLAGPVVIHPERVLREGRPQGP